MEESAEDGARRVVLFDFDGAPANTPSAHSSPALIRGDAFGLFMRDCYRRARWRTGLLLLLVPWLLAVLPFSRSRALRIVVQVGLIGTREARCRARIEAFAQRLVHRSRQFHREGLWTVRRHQAAGDRVVVVTGCEETLVRGILAGLGLEDVEVLASRLRPGRFGLRPAWHNVGPRKVQLLARHDLHAWQVAYGDSIHDLPMLALAAEPVLVNATPKLCMRVEKALGRSVARVQWD